MKLHKIENGGGRTQRPQPASLIDDDDDDERVSYSVVVFIG